MDLMSLPDGQRCRSNGRLEGSFLGFEITFRLSIMENDPFVAVIDNRIICQSHNYVLPDFLSEPAIVRHVPKQDREEMPGENLPRFERVCWSKLTV